MSALLLVAVLAVQGPSFAAVDAHADAAPDAVESSVPTLAAYLSRAGSDELSRTRAIFRWVTGNIDYDAAGLRSGDYGDLSPEGVLRRRRAVCQGYAQLTEALGTAMGLRVQVISGWSKGYGYRQGQAFDGPPNHAWNVVQIAGRWRLMDPTWGAGYLDERFQFVRRFQEHYFLTDPADFVFDHLPEQASWQMLERPVSAQQYLAMARLTPGFFLSGLRIGSHPQGRIEAAGTVQVTLGVTRPVELIAQVLDAATQRPLEGGWAFVQSDDRRAEVMAAFPQAGQYLLRLFAKPRGAEGPAGWALDYLVDAAAGEVAGFPGIYSAFGATGAWLSSPITGTLRAGRTQRFELRAPGALDVAIVAGGRWTHFTKNGDVFTADYSVSVGPVQVFAKYDAAGQYTGLLEFRVR